MAIRGLKLLFCLWILGIFILACKNNPDTSATTNSQTAADSVMADEDFSMLLPSPVQIFNKYKKSGLEYQLNIINPCANAPKYYTNLSKSLNLGVYLGDLAYLILNNKLNETREYIKTVKDLSEEVGMANMISPDFGKRFENNMEKPDSLLAIFALVKEQMDAYFNLTVNKPKQIILFMGTYVESLHISLQGYHGNNEQLKTIILDQLSLSENLYSRLQKYPEKTQSIEKLTRELGKITTLNNKISTNPNPSFDELKTIVGLFRNAIITGKI